MHANFVDSTPAADTTASPRHQVSGFVGRAGTPIYTQSWLPQSEPTGIVVISHGLGEHGGRYAAVAASLTAQGYAVHALDHRGHGRSGNAPRGRRANLGRFGDVVADLADQIELAAESHRDRPLFLLGHSMGGTIALAYALRYPQGLRGLVLSAPVLSVAQRVPAATLAVVRALSTLRPNIGVHRLAAAAVSRDPGVVRAYEQDPLVHHGAIPARTVTALLGAVSLLTAQAHQVRLPSLILHGSADRLVPLAGNRATYERIAGADKTVRIYDGLYHEVLNEPEREQVLGDVIAWLDRHR